MATSPNFNWPEPDNTDLVKNGALAIRTAVDAIDSSLADLKGGTTGQVLSKTSNTDMDFTWVAQDDSNAIQNAIVDAKGDLIAATANDTPARLAIGANNEMLVADSTTATGLDWKTAAEQYPWITYTPTLTNLTIGNGTVTARYQRIGKLINVFVRIGLGSTSSVGTEPNFTLPSTLAVNGIAGYAWGDRSGVGGTPLNFLLLGNVCRVFAIGTTTTYAGWIGVTATVPFTWATNDAMFFQLSYEEA